MVDGMLRAFACRGGVVCAWVLLLPWASALNPNHNLAQSVHRIWQNQPGLRQSTINVVSQTSDGYLWLGTPSGVVRFDGSRFTSVPALEQAALGDFWARIIVEDSARRVWMLSNDLRLVLVGNAGVKVFSQEDGLPFNEVSCLASGRSGAVWICTPDGLARFLDGQWRVYPAGGRLKERQIAACQASDNTVWMAGGSAITSWNGSAFTTHKLNSVPADTAMRALLCATDGSLWVGTGNGLVQVKDGEEHLYLSQSGLADNVINSLAEGRGGNLWIGTGNGLSRFHDGVFDNYGYREGLSQSTVFSLFEDREGSLWVATKHGLNQFMDGAAARFTKNEGLPSDNVGPLLLDRRGKLWAGTLDGGLARFDGVRFIPIAHFSNNRVTALAEATDGALWAGTDRGLIRFEEGPAWETYTTQQGLPSDKIYSLFRDHSGALWAGTERGPVKFDRGRFAQAPGLGKLRSPVVAMGETRDGQMLFAVEGDAVYLFANGRLRQMVDRDGPGRNVDAFYTDQDGLVWMGATANGLRMWRDGKILRFQVRDGLFDGEIYGILPDREGHLWMSCSKGFFRVSRSELLDFAAGKIRKITSLPYSPLDGLRTIEGKQGVQPVGAITADGRLWFSTTYGVLAFGPRLAVRDVPPPPVVIEEVNVNGETVAPNRIHNLAPGQKNLEFDYTAPTFVAPDRTTFRYILEGYDGNWTEAGTRREASYTNLPPGKFRFRVSACNPFIPCTETDAALQFELLPSFYQRVWFLPFCVTLLAMLAWLAYQFRIRRLREKFRLVLAERSRIARELHDTLIQGFSGITMELQALAGRVRSPEERRSLHEIIGDAGECLRETRRSVAGLRAWAGASPGLAAAIADAARQITQEQNIRLKLNLDETQPELPAEVKYNLLCIAQEAVSNSVKHSGAHTIEIGLSCSGRIVRLSVHDDGCGMSGDLNGGVQTGHYGLIGMKERASQIGAEFELASFPGRGTRIFVQVPVTREAYITSSQERQEASR
jgi:signal transduction histidine kinase/ligand-binding sensor domain-containing protein